MSGFPWNRFVMPWQYAPAESGAPSPGDKLNFYVSGTSTPQDTFADSTLSTENSNPVVADQDGLWPDIFLQNLSYKVVWTDSEGNEKRTADPVSPYVASSVTQQSTVVISFTVDGNGGIPPVGKTMDQYVPFDCDITAAVLMADGPGDVVVDVWAKEFETNSPPTATDSITASDPPTLTTSQSSIDTVLAGWSKHIAAGTAIRCNVESIDSISRFTLSLIATRSSS